MSVTKNSIGNIITKLSEILYTDRFDKKLNIHTLHTSDFYDFNNQEWDLNTYYQKIYNIRAFDLLNQYGCTDCYIMLCNEIKFNQSNLYMIYYYTMESVKCLHFAGNDTELGKYEVYVEYNDYNACEFTILLNNNIKIITIHNKNIYSSPNYIIKKDDKQICFDLNFDDRQQILKIIYDNIERILNGDDSMLKKFKLDEK